ncbi:nitroreductase family protein [Candidatus Woesearchaeota archaeon]|nr:nitroreductase family protein [Candidatus Woesearchaeota archaeon]
MELDQVLKERRSVRKFKNLNVPWYLISECLEAAIQAPSSGNVQNWRFVVVRDKESREKIAKACDEQYWMTKAPVFIVVCSDVVKIKRLFGPRGEALYAVQNCSAAIENMLLKAHELGLGTTWIGAFDESKIKEIIGIPGEVRPQGIFAIGYPEVYDEKPRREPLENFVFFEKYSQREDKERGKLIPAVDVIKRHTTKIIEKHKK